MAVMHVERTRDYTVMSNHHLKNSALTLKAKGLLSLILSLPDEWQYSTRGLAAICKEGVDAIGTALRELETAGYIIRNQLRDSGGRITDTEYVIYEHPPVAASSVSIASPQAEKLDHSAAPPLRTRLASLDSCAASEIQPNTTLPDTEAPDTEKPYMEEPDMAAPDTDMPAELNTKVNKEKEDKLNTLSNTQSFFPSQAPAADRPTDVMEKREDILEQIEYGHITNFQKRHQIDEFVELMLEIALTQSPDIKIGRDTYPVGFVRERFSKISSEHILKILDGISENTTRVWNTKAYLLAALFNAPVSTDNHYTMLVNHDLYNGSE